MNEERIEAALEAELERRAGRATGDGAMVCLEPAEQAEVDSLVEIADLLWEAADHEPPPLEADPSAIMLGLAVDPAITIDKDALKRCRMREGLKQSDLAARLAARGWDVATKDVFGWETKTAHGLCPALIHAIAEVLGVWAETVTLHRDTTQETVVEKVQKTQRFVDLVRMRAGRFHTSFEAARTELVGQMMATANRGPDLTVDQWCDVLAQLDPCEPDQPSPPR